VIDRVNRVALGLIGAVMAAAGVIGLLARRRAIDLAEPGTLYRRVHRNVVDHPETWKWSAIAPR